MRHDLNRSHILSCLLALYSISFVVRRELLFPISRPLYIYCENANKKYIRGNSQPGPKAPKLEPGFIALAPLVSISSPQTSTNIFSTDHPTTTHSAPYPPLRLPVEPRAERPSTHPLRVCVHAARALAVRPSGTYS